MKILIFLIRHYNVTLFLLTCILQNDVFTVIVWLFWGAKAVRWALIEAGKRDSREGWIN